MKVRSITLFYNPDKDPDYQMLDSIAEFTFRVKNALLQAGFDVQSTRLATTPFPLLLKELKIQHAVDFAIKMESAANARGFNYLSLGPAMLSHPQSYQMIHPILASTQNTFLSAEMASKKTGISLKAIKSCANIIKDASTITADGFANLRFACLANVASAGPFFPSSYHLRHKPSFALAIEAADIALTAFRNSGSIKVVRKNILTELELQAKRLTRICKKNSKQGNIKYSGIDFSFAPFPTSDCSIASAIEHFGVSAIGRLGSTAAAAILAEVLDRGSWKKAGFNGLMFPVLEDSVLAERSKQKILTIKDLLLYSTVCGTGLDTVPLPGNITAPVIASILLDVAALAMRLDKPLTARLMPIPGKLAGEFTEYDFEYFENGGILEVPSDGLQGLFAGSESFLLKSRKKIRKSQSNRF